MTDNALKSPRWFAADDPHSSRDGPLGTLMKTGVGLVAGGVLATFGYLLAAVVVCTLALVLGVVSLASGRARLAIAACFGRLGLWIGRLMSMVILAPIYLVGFTAANLWQRLGGADPLRLRDDGRESFWLPADGEKRKRRYAFTMFATERLRRPAVRRLLPAAVGLLVLAAAAELTLRGMGFGDPVLYVSDPLVGYYPAPNQDVDRYGGRVATNRFGMRSPEFAAAKPPGTLRVLMIGDSTLYGGSYVDQADLYSQQLQEHLERLTPQASVEVLNVGVNAWGPFHKQGYIKRYGTFDADVAIVCMPIGDIYRPLGSLARLPYFSADRPPTCAIEEVAAHLMWRYRTQLAGRWSEAAHDEQGQRGIAAYVELAELLRSHGCEVHFEILPSKAAATTDEVPANQLRDVTQLREALAAAGFHSAGYPAGMFCEEAASEVLYHDDCHLQPEGHRLYAEYLTDRLAQQSVCFADRSSPILQASRTEIDREHPRR